MVQSVELLLDEPSEGAVRAEWDRLAAAGLPSQARHRSPTNRPHVTVIAERAIDESLEPRLRTAATRSLPMEIRIGGLVVFGRGPFILVRLVVARRALLDLHAAVAETVGVEPPSWSSPGHWTPHVTLAHRMSAAQVAAALPLLCVPHEPPAHLVSARRWDGEAKQVRWSTEETDPA